MKIETGKIYKTRCGFNVRIYATDGYGGYPIHGAILTKYGWEIRWWTSDGKNIADGESKLDIISEASPFEFDKSVLPKWAKGICMTKYKRWYFYTDNIKLERINDSEFWCCESLDIIPTEYAPKNYTGRWQDSHYTIDQL